MQAGAWQVALADLIRQIRRQLETPAGRCWRDNPLLRQAIEPSDLAEDEGAWSRTADAYQSGRRFWGRRRSIEGRGSGDPEPGRRAALLRESGRHGKASCHWPSSTPGTIANIASIAAELRSKLDGLHDEHRTGCRTGEGPERPGRQRRAGHGTASSQTANTAEGRAAD